MPSSSMTRRTAMAGLAAFGIVRPTSAQDRLTIQQTPEWPWQAQTYIRGNIAAGSLRETLLKRLKNERGIHAETLASAIGALAGFASQNAALRRAAEATRNKQPTFPNIYLAETKDGQRFLLGDWVNAQLLGQAGERFSLVAFIAQGYSQNGMDETLIAEVTRLIKQTTSLLGDADFGKSHALEKHKPGFPPIELLQQLWSTALDVFRQPPPSGVEEPEIDEKHWGPICNFVAAQYMEMTKQALDRKVYFTLAMEAAIICSKLDPEKIDPGKWAITAKDGKLMVSRLRA
ncbi:MAG: hypothetical protein NW215_10385 [Hyphomicrobiales bacterium]|nr:hypothetical protein [Hyphomicrobiales bacterium]